MATHHILRRIHNPPNEFQSMHLDWSDFLEDGLPPKTKLELFEDQSRTILSKNDSPDIAFDYSINPYRGCFHGCAYCYARPSHQYLDFGAGTDFERKILIKKKAPELLLQAFNKPSWKGDLIVFSGNTDCYQPLESHFGLTKRCLEICLDYQNPAFIITKSTLVERDAELISELHKISHCPVVVSIPFMNKEHARAIEPYVPSPNRRFKVIEHLVRAGCVVGVNVAPIIPGLTDSDAPQILKRAKSAGATFFGTTLLRLPSPLNHVFEERIRALLPLRADKIIHQLKECRDGKLYNSKFGKRMKGEGQRWHTIMNLIEESAKRLGFSSYPSAPKPSQFKRPNNTPQLSLF